MIQDDRHLTEREFSSLALVCKSYRSQHKAPRRDVNGSQRGQRHDVRTYYANVRGVHANSKTNNSHRKFREKPPQNTSYF